MVFRACFTGGCLALQNAGSGQVKSLRQCKRDGCQQPLPQAGCLSCNGTLSRRSMTGKTSSTGAYGIACYFAMRYHLCVEYKENPICVVISSPEPRCASSFGISHACCLDAMAASGTACIRYRRAMTRELHPAIGPVCYSDDSGNGFCTHSLRTGSPACCRQHRGDLLS